MKKNDTSTKVLLCTATAILNSASAVKCEGITISSNTLDLDPYQYIQVPRRAGDDVASKRGLSITRSNILKRILETNPNLSNLDDDLIVVLNADRSGRVTRIGLIGDEEKSDIKIASSLKEKLRKLRLHSCDSLMKFDIRELRQARERAASEKASKTIILTGDRCEP